MQGVRVQRPGGRRRRLKVGAAARGDHGRQAGEKITPYDCDACLELQRARDAPAAGAQHAGAPGPPAEVKPEPDVRPAYDHGPAIVWRHAMDAAELVSLRSQLADALKANVTLQVENKNLKALAEDAKPCVIERGHELKEQVVAVKSEPGGL
jgi:hypothetical protein